MQLGETIATYDVDLALRGESGKFEVTSPLGETYYITCNHNQAVLKSQLADDQTYPQAFLVRKIAESVSSGQASRTNSSGNLAAEDKTPMSDRIPFLLEHRQLQSNPVSEEIPDPALTETGHDTASEIWNLNLFYAQGASGTEQPFASVHLTESPEDPTRQGSGKSLTAACRNFNDLDCEIRRLHAQLETIRAQAKKKFYKAHAAAASA